MEVVSTGEITSLVYGLWINKLLSQAILVAVNLSFSVKGNNLLPELSLFDLPNPDTANLVAVDNEKDKKARAPVGGGFCV